MIKEIIGSKISNLKKLYQEEYNVKSFFLEADGHKIYYELSGNEKGIPVLYLHGGPGGSCGDVAKRFFDKDKYRIVTIDQRGTGKSLPIGKLEDNNTFKLIEDIESIRKILNIEKWVVFGGSWGSTLALSYAISYPEKIDKLVLRGIFLGRKEDIDWLYKKDGAGQIFYKEYSKFLSVLNEEEKKSPLESYFKHISKNDENTLKYSKYFSDFESSCVKLIKPEITQEITESDYTHAIMETWYFINSCFFPSDNYILDNIDKIKDIKTYIVHGRYDVVCTIKGAYELYYNLNNAIFYIVQDAGHSWSEDGIMHILREIMEEI